jgi:hypothetical protein
MGSEIEELFVFDSETQCSRCGATGAYDLVIESRCPNCIPAINSLGHNDIAFKNVLNLVCALQLKVSRLHHRLILLLHSANELCKSLNDTPEGIIKTNDPAFLNLSAVVDKLKDELPRSS